MYQIGPGSAPGMGASPAPPGVAGLREALYVLGKWKVVVVLVVIGAVGTAGVFTEFLIPKVYRASATVDVTQLVTSVPAGGAGGASGGGLQGAVNQVTAQPTATMPTLLWEITSPNILDAAAKLLSSGVSASAGSLGGSVSASQVTGTNLISISATSHDPARAAAIANAVAQAFVANETATASGTVGQGLAELEQEATTVKGQLDQASAALAAAEEQPGAAASTQSQVTTDNSEIASLSGQQAQADVQLQSAISAVNAIKANMAGVPPTISSTSASSTAPAQAQANPDYQALTQQLAAAQVKLAQDKATANALYQETLQYNDAIDPTGYQAAQQAYNQAQVAVDADQAGIQALQNELAQTPSTLPAAPQAAPTVTVTPNPTYTALQQQLQSAEVTVAQDQAQVNTIAQELPPLETQVAQMETQSTSADASVQAAKSKVDTLTATYQTLETNITNAQVAQALSSNAPAAQVEAPAGASGGLISPKKKEDLAIAFLLGLVVGCALAFILEQFDNTIKTPDDVRRVVGLPTLAVIPIVRS